MVGVVGLRWSRAQFEWGEGVRGSYESLGRRGGSGPNRVNGQPVCVISEEFITEGERGDHREGEKREGGVEGESNIGRKAMVDIGEGAGSAPVEGKGLCREGIDTVRGGVGGGRVSGESVVTPDVTEGCPRGEGVGGKEPKTTAREGRMVNSYVHVNPVLLG